MRTARFGLLAALAVSAVLLVAPTSQADQPGWTGRTTLVGIDGGTGMPLMDSANRAYTLPIAAFCSVYAQSVTAVGTTAVTVPTARSWNSRGVTICNSQENTGSPKLKCLLDPNADAGPFMGLTNQGEVLGVGDCAQFPVEYTHVVKCVSDTAGTAATATECTP